jgi:hypothetical protein
MSAPEHILSKVKLLRNLSNSPNANEAASALAMANKLIEKYNITDEELKSIEDKPPKYGDNEFLFHTFQVQNWLQQLALACAKNFYCHIVQEELRPPSGTSEFKYYVYGEEEDVNSTKFVFHTILKKINNLVDIKCLGRGPIFVESYREGVVEAIKNNIANFGVEVPEIKRPSRPIEPEKTLNVDSGNLAQVSKEKKEKPEQETVDIGGGTLIRDVMAYFKGLEDGNRLSLNDILELEAENEKLKELQDPSTQD